MRSTRSFGRRCYHAAAPVSMILLGLFLRPALSVKNSERRQLPSEVEKTLGELLTSATEMKSLKLNEEMTKIISDLTDVAHLSDENRKQLEADAKVAVEKSLELWRKELDARLRPYLGDEIQGSLEKLSHWPAETLLNIGSVAEPAMPTECEEWKNALKKMLSADQLASMEKISQSREQTLGKEIQDYLKPYLAKMRKRQELMLKAEAVDIRKATAMTGDRAAKVSELAMVAAKRCAGSIERKWTSEMRGMNEETRASLTMNGDHQPFMDENDEALLEMEEWKKTLHEFLSPEEQKQWVAASILRKERRSRALAALLISEIDSRVFLSAAQREKLEPVLAKSMSPGTRSEWDNSSFGLSDLSILEDDRIKQIIDEKQLRHLKSQSENELVDGPSDSGQGISKAEGIASETDPDVEATLSAFFHAYDLKHRKMLAREMLPKLESIKRVVKLSDDAYKSLEIASKGAAEHALNLGRPNIEQWVRNAIGNVNSRQLKQRLASFNSMEFNPDAPRSIYHQLLWTNAVHDVLTEAQMELLANDVSGRASYLNRARLLIILEELNWTYHLSLEQFEKLEPILNQVVTEYVNDIIPMIGSDGSAVRQMTVLLAGVPPDKTRSILTPEQLELWNESDKDLWSNTKSNHDQRMKRNSTRNSGRTR